MASGAYSKSRVEEARAWHVEVVKPPPAPQRAALEAVELPSSVAPETAVAVFARHPPRVPHGMFGARA